MQIKLSDHFTYGRLLRYTLPTIVMIIFTSLYSVVDGLFVSNLVGDLALSAVNIAFPITMIIGAFGFMLGTGGSAIVGITLGEGEFTTYGNTSPEKSLTFVGAGTGTVWTIGDLDKDVGGEGNGDYSFEGCDTITFKNMTLKVDNKNYRGFIRINHTVVENCTLEGRTAYWGYETAKFVGSTFTAPEGDYALWDYSTKDMSFDGCKFNISGKGVHVYVEAANADKDVTRTVAVNNCTVNSTKANKAFLNIKNSTQSYDVTLSGTTR